MPKKAIDKEKTTRDMHNERVKASRETVRRERERLSGVVARIRATCPGSIGAVFRNLEERFVSVGKRLESNPGPEVLFADPRYKARVERTVMSGCRFKERVARIQAEPVIRAGKVAYQVHKETRAIDQASRKQERDRKGENAGKIPRTAKMSEAEEAVVREIEAHDPKLARLWPKYRAAVYRKVKKSEGLNSVLEAFLEYVEGHLKEVKADLAELNKVDDRKLAEAQAAHAKQRSREQGEAIPSEAFVVPDAPKSSIRPSQRAASERVPSQRAASERVPSQRAHDNAPASVMAATVASGSGPVAVGAVKHEGLAEELAKGMKRQETPLRAWRYPNGVEVIQVGRFVGVGLPDGAVRTKENIPKKANPLAIASKLVEAYFKEIRGALSEVPFSVPANDSQRERSHGA